MTKSELAALANSHLPDDARQVIGRMVVAGDLAKAETIGAGIRAVALAVYNRALEDFAMSIACTCEDERCPAERYARIARKMKEHVE